MNTNYQVERREANPTAMERKKATSRPNIFCTHFRKASSTIKVCVSV